MHLTQQNKSFRDLCTKIIQSNTHNRNEANFNGFSLFAVKNYHFFNTIALTTNACMLDANFRVSESMKTCRLNCGL